MNIFITGVSSGIGMELARHLVKTGHLVWGVARSEKPLDKLAAEINSPNFKYSICDVSNQTAREKCLKAMKAEEYLPDIVVLNASVFSNDINNNFDFEIARETLNINLYGSLAWVASWLSEFANRDSGQFIAICSTAAFRSNLRSVSYPTSKAALDMAFRTLRLKYSHTNIAFSTIYFGPVASPMWEGRQSALLASPTAAAEHIIKIINTKKDRSYFPLLSTTIFRLTKFVPDKYYSKITEKILK